MYATTIRLWQASSLRDGRRRRAQRLGDLLRVGAVLLLLSLVHTNAARAESSLTLSISSPDHLDNIEVGALVTFEISVSGASAEPAGFLLASVEYNPTIFSDPMVQAGSIVPSVVGFDSSGTGAGTVTAFYDDSIFGTLPIASEGRFYSFTLLRIGLDATMLSFSSFAAMNDLGQIIAVSADPASIAVGAAPNSVPEPPSIALVLSGCLLAICLRFTCGFPKRFRTEDFN